MVLSKEDEKNLVLALARGRALTASAKQQIYDGNVREKSQTSGVGAPLRLRHDADHQSQQSGERLSARDGFWVSEADELIQWAEDMEIDDSHPIVRLLIDGGLMVVGMRSDANGREPVLRWSVHPSDTQSNSMLAESSFKKEDRS